MIKRTIVYKSADTLVRLYKSLVRPHLEYCTAAWSPHYLKDRKLLEKIQRRFTHMVPGLQELPYESRLISLKLWTLDRRRVRADLIELFKMVRGLSTVDVNTFFEFDNTGRTRGHCLKLRKGRVSTDLRQNFFTERVFNTWNQLESSVVESESPNLTLTLTPKLILALSTSSM